MEVFGSPATRETGPGREHKAHNTVVAEHRRAERSLDELSTAEITVESKVGRSTDPRRVLAFTARHAIAFNQGLSTV